MVACLAKDPTSDFPPEEGTGGDGYTGSVDWDAEWKKVVKNKALVEENRPGKDYYKSEAEIAAIKAANRATKQVDRVAERVASNMPSLPTWNSVKGDWKVCVIFESAV